MSKLGEEASLDKSGIEEVAVHSLKQAGVYGRFPTHIDRLANSLRLTVYSINLKEVRPNYSTDSPKKLSKVLNKIRGVVDIPNQYILVDNTATLWRQRFVTLHEIGHADLPWQRVIFESLERPHVDSSLTLSPSCKSLLELEASYYAASTLFQGIISQELIFESPLTIEAICDLAENFGASFHAMVRRFIEFTPQVGALLVLTKASSTFNKKGNIEVVVQQYFLSKSFKETFPEVKWGKKTFSVNTPFVLDVFDPNITKGNGIFHYSNITWEYGYFEDGYTHFVIVTEG